MARPKGSKDRKPRAKRQYRNPAGPLPAGAPKGAIPSSGYASAAGPAGARGVRQYKSPVTGPSPTLKTRAGNAAASVAGAARSGANRVRSAAGTASRVAKSDAANVVGGFKKGGFKTGMRTLAGSRTGRVAGAAGLVGAGAGIAAYINQRRKRNR